MSASAHTSQLQIAHELTLKIGTILDLSSLSDVLTTELRRLTACERIVIAHTDEDAGLLRISAQEAVSLYAEHPALTAWRTGSSYTAALDDPPLTPLARSEAFYGVPLLVEGAWEGVLVVENPITEKPIGDEACALIAIIAPMAAIALHNARRHTQTVASLDTRMLELSILNQIDRELSDTIDLSHVFDMTLDWAMRYTNANAGSLALYDQAADQLKFVVDLGYEAQPENVTVMRSLSGGIAHRVALSSFSELVPDVAADKDYLELSSAIRSHMSVPVTREDRVIAVISVESRKINAFTDEHLSFVEKLAARAGVAIDNARLFTETMREREKLAHILAEVADGVIVLDHDERIVLINQAAMAAFRLYPELDYAGQRFADSVDDEAFIAALRHVYRLGNKALEEITLPNGKTYYVDFSPRSDIGWIVVMNDITPLRETDQLKRDLIATVSHDLKQPLSVMSGYLDLLQMSQKLDGRGENYVRMISRSILNMRQLIDDLLDLAKIDAGLALEIEPVKIHQVIETSVDNLSRLIDAKSMRVEVKVARDLPPIAGDPARLLQIINNLVSNAIKYTPPEGLIGIDGVLVDGAVRIAVRDSGIGISPEDQSRIFDRFYRVRRAENENIEGTGLGLTIVKKLVDAHHGQIGLESFLGGGTTFYITLPLYEQ
ncbi:MAG: GAF domain-containing protein [Anaerolinea sp.]|nr:GAF domain-containing protein [Anaerolinea sp.]